MQLTLVDENKGLPQPGCMSKIINNDMCTIQFNIYLFIYLFIYFLFIYLFIYHLFILLKKGWGRRDWWILNILGISTHGKKIHTKLLHHIMLFSYIAIILMQKYFFIKAVYIQM